MEIALAAIVAVGALIFVFSLMGRARNLQQPEEPQQKRMSRREKKLAQLREYDPLPEQKSILDIVREEAAELGVDDVPGGEDLETPVKLRVWKRDAAVRAACDGDVRYEIAAGVTPAEATVDDVRLVCADGSHPTTVPQSEPDAVDEDQEAQGDAPDGAEQSA